MLENLSSFTVMLPTFAAILALVLFTEKTKLLSFSLATLAVFAELVPADINIMALATCVGCVTSMLLIQYLRSYTGFNKKLTH